MKNQTRDIVGAVDNSQHSRVRAHLGEVSSVDSSGITLVLPYPPSANRCWRSRVVKGISMTYVSTEARDYKKQVAWLARQAGIWSPMAGRMAVSYVLYPKRPLDWAKRAAKDPGGWDDTVQCLDLDNCQKVLLDALKGVVFDDDKWVRRINAERAEPDGDARLVVTIRPIPLIQGSVA